MSDTTMMHLTCKNHPKARYLTKRIPGRSLHWVAADPDYVLEVDPTLKGSSEEFLANYTVPRFECPCPAGDLVEVDE